MTVAPKLVAFAAAVAAAITLGFGIGRAVGPWDGSSSTPTVHPGHDMEVGR